MVIQPLSKQTLKDIRELLLRGSTDMEIHMLYDHQLGKDLTDRYIDIAGSETIRHELSLANRSPIRHFNFLKLDRLRGTR